MAAPSQLQMRFTDFKQLVPPRMPPGYGLRTFRPGDEVAWLAMLRQGEFGHWDRERLDGMLAGEQVRVPRDGVFFATVDRQPVAAACTMLHQSADGAMAELGWVIVDPAHRGRGLALEVCRAVLSHISSLGYGYAVLYTEDFRLPALATYLRLGFAPEMVDEGQPERWAEVRRKLGR